MIDRKNIANIFPLTPLQEGMLFRELASGGSAYLMQTRLNVSGGLDADDFRRAWEMLVERHEALRTLVTHDSADRPLQVALKHIDIHMPVTDLSEHSEKDRISEIDSFCLRERESGFDLKRPPLFRIGLFRIAPTRHILVLTFHHIIMDGWCQGILHEELLECYHAVKSKRRPNLPAVQPFSRYVRYLSEHDTASGLSFWQSIMDGYDPGGETSWMKHAGTGEHEFDLRMIDFSLPVDTTQRLKEIAAECGTTINAAVQTLWGTVVCRLSGKRDAAWGTVVSGRPPELSGSDRTIGLFINTIPVRFRMDSTASFRNALMATGRFFGASIGHQHVPLADIQQACGARNGLFDHLMIFENYPVSDMEDQPGALLTLTQESPLQGHTDYDLVCVADAGETVDFRLKYDAAVLDEQTVDLLRFGFMTLADHVIVNPDAPLVCVRILPDEMFNYVIRILPEGDRQPEPTSAFPALFSAQAHKTPERPAVEAINGTLSYRELDRASDAIARILIAEEKIEKGDRIALMTGRDLSMIPAIIGIMKASAVFVPLDPGYPDERVRFIIEDCRCRAVVAGKASLDRMRTLGAIPVIDAERAFIVQNTPSDWQCPFKPGLRDIAYIIYTSGSTGTPKGVMVEHRSLANFIGGYIRTVLDNHENPLRIAFVANYIFDAAGRAFYPSLCRGDTVVVVDEQTRIDSGKLMRLIATRTIDILDGTPSLGCIAMESGDICETVSRIVLGGEALTRSIAERLHTTFPNAALTNVYGPTETTIDSTFYHVSREYCIDWGIAPIGRPLPNQRTFVLDSDLLPLPFGAAGEIVIGGAGVARGYLGRDELTGERFVTDPFNPGEMLYRTGDKGHWQSDGNLLYIGRSDSQVKVRGFRIETGEIEAVISKEPEIDQCAVIVKADTESGNTLCLVYSGDIDARELRKRIKRSLPSHMVPDMIVSLDRLQLTPTGKIDRVSLAAMTMSPAVPEKSGDKALSPEEQMIIDAMNKTLGRNDIAPDDNFFESGGHSLKAARLISILATVSGKRLPIYAVYRFPTPADLAVFLERFDPEVSGLMDEFRFHFNEAVPKLFCFPPYGATGIVYHRLAQSLKDYRFECFNFLSGMDFVREAVRAILPEALTSPVTLLGYSGGGNLAYETAREIEKSGGTVGLIVMLDSYRRLESADIPRSRHEQEIRTILSSEEYSIYFPDTTRLEAAIGNGVAYAEYLYSGMEEGCIDAPIVVVGAGTDKDEAPRDRFGILRSREKWDELTRGTFDFIRGHGAHDTMLDGSDCDRNASILHSLLD